MNKLTMTTFLSIKDPSFFLKALQKPPEPSRIDAAILENNVNQNAAKLVKPQTAVFAEPNFADFAKDELGQAY
jgi:hypothetical protein